MKTDKPLYSVTLSESALGIEYRFFGPGMPQYANNSHFLQPLNEWATKQIDANRSQFEAERVLGMLYRAFEAGRESKLSEIRLMLGIK